MRVIWVSYGVDFTAKKAELPKHDRHETKIVAQKIRTNLRGDDGGMLIEIMRTLVFISTACASCPHERSHNDFQNVKRD
jgi:hypothetical protein